MNLRPILFIFALINIVGWGPMNVKNLYSFLNVPPIKNSQTWINVTAQAILSQANNLDPHVLKVGLTAYLKARQRGLDPKQLLTLVDYTKPADERRLWVIDLKTDKVLFNTWVAHGKNSGHSILATSFSNSGGSLKSSLGVFVTDESYFGDNGYSLRVKGLEGHINDHAYQRKIVFHGARYVSAETAKTGYLGHSWGCFAVSRNVIIPLINAIKEHTLVVAYYPDPNWLSHSAFV